MYAPQFSWHEYCIASKKKCMLVSWLSKETAEGSQIDKNCQQLPAA